jgi:hypothetical protein
MLTSQEYINYVGQDDAIAYQIAQSRVGDDPNPDNGYLEIATKQWYWDAMYSIYQGTDKNLALLEFQGKIDRYVSCLAEQNITLTKESDDQMNSCASEADPTWDTGIVP